MGVFLVVCTNCRNLEYTSYGTNHTYVDHIIIVIVTKNTTTIKKNENKVTILLLLVAYSYCYFLCISHPSSIILIVSFCRIIAVAVPCEIEFDNNLTNYFFQKIMKKNNNMKCPGFTYVALLVMMTILFTCLPVTILGFVPQHHQLKYSTPSQVKQKLDIEVPPSFSTTNSNTDSTTAASTPSIDEINSQISVPKTLNELINQVSTSIKLAQEDGDGSSEKTRQIIRILLPRDSKSAQLGQYFESEIENSNSLDLDSFTLVPPDETWQGGIMQLYRAISIPAKLILRNLGGTVGGVPPTIIEDRSIDTSNVDGVGIFQSQVPNNPSKDICCFVQPLQETVDVIESICDQAGNDRLVLLLNPQWRNIDDALDTVSKQSGFMGSFASFLGGKGNSLKRLENLGFESTYIIEGYVCKGGNVRLMKRFDSDWIVFAENDSETE